MTARRIAIAVALALAAGVLLFGMRQCARGDAPACDPATSPAPSGAVAGAEDPAATAADAERERRAATIAAIEGAVSTLHAYLAALGKPDKAEANAFWSGGRVPSATGEADLRTLEGMTGFRTQNGQPIALDTGMPPAALEIPVRLRVGVPDGPLRRYEGHYRLRRAVTGDRWEITSADIRSSAAP